jgi:hypothetical protein
LAVGRVDSVLECFSHRGSIHDFIQAVYQYKVCGFIPLKRLKRQGRASIRVTSGRLKLVGLTPSNNNVQIRATMASFPNTSTWPAAP